MKVFISADMEGITTTTLWDHCETLEKPALSSYHAQQMTNEVKAACEGAIAAGADYILVKDAHDSGTNIDIAQLPECVEVIRNWSGHPYSMVTGINPEFDACLFIGYHSAAGRDGNPLSHTMSGAPLWVKINGRKVSEFMLYSWAAAFEKVPTVFLAGDRMLCDDYRDLHPMLRTVAVKDGFGGMIKAMHPKVACDRIRTEVEAALRQDLSHALCTMPTDFEVEICYKEHKLATRRSFFPGYSKEDDNTIHMHTDSLYDVLNSINFLI